jgi:hypothetical protein
MMKKYPEHEKLKVVSEKTQFVHDFLQWCEVQGIFLEKDGMYKRHDELLYKFTGINRWKLEDEKRAMLDGIRTAKVPGIKKA